MAGNNAAVQGRAVGKPQGTVDDLGSGTDGELHLRPSAPAHSLWYATRNELLPASTKPVCCIGASLMLSPSSCTWQR
jgi:hypothetical protein